MPGYPLRNGYPMPVYLNGFVPDTFEHAAVEGGLPAIFALAATRLQTMPPLSERLRAALSASIDGDWLRGSMDGKHERLVEFASVWGDALMASLLAEGTAARLLSPTAILALLLRENKAGISDIGLFRLASRLHERLKAHGEWQAAPASGIRQELLAYAEHARRPRGVGRPRKPMSPRATTALLNAADRISKSPTGLRTPDALATAALAAADEWPRGRPPASGTDICRLLSEAHRVARGLTKIHASNTDGYARGATHDFIVACSSPYCLQLAVGSSGGYLRRLCRSASSDITCSLGLTLTVYSNFPL